MLPNPQRSRQLQQLSQKLGLSATAPIDWSLLDLALTHPSFAQTQNYQQLEFVGDSVVRLAAAEVLMAIYPDDSVGDFAAIRSVLVSDRLLADLAESYGIEEYLLMASSAAADQGGKTSRLADAFEAILGALYLSTGTMELVRPWLNDLLKHKAAEIRRDPARHNYKDALQEWTQAQHCLLPQYRVHPNSTQAQEQRFTAEVWLQDRLLGKGQGRTKKAAQQAAAKQAFFSVVDT